MEAIQVYILPSSILEKKEIMNNCYKTVINNNNSGTNSAETTKAA